MLFGTFRNPRGWKERCGFGQKEYEFGRMLAGVDVNKTDPAETKP
jgi:hypothetical protein